MIAAERRAIARATPGAWFRRLTRDRRTGQPKLIATSGPGDGDFILSRERVAEMWRLIELAEGQAHRATSTDKHIAKCLHAAIDQAADIVTAGTDRDPDQLVNWLARFDEAVERLRRVERLG